MKIAFFDLQSFEKDFFLRANKSFGHEIEFIEARLNRHTALLAERCKVVCASARDTLDGPTLTQLKSCGVELIALRSTGFNQVDLNCSANLRIPVIRIPAYATAAVAEFAVSLMLCLSRKIHLAHHRMAVGSDSLEDLVGFELQGKTVGIFGTGKTGSAVARILSDGFGCQVLACDPVENLLLSQQQTVQYVKAGDVFRYSDIVSLHLPLTPATRHWVDREAISAMRSGSMLINIGPSALVESSALIAALKSGQVGFGGMDLFEEQEGIYFQEADGERLQPEAIRKLISFSNVLITPHQAYLTRENLSRIAEVTLSGVSSFEKGDTLENVVRPEMVRAGQWLNTA